MAKLFKKDEKFFKIFGKMTVYILEAAEILGKMLRNPADDLAPLAARIKDLLPLPPGLKTLSTRAMN